MILSLVLLGIGIAAYSISQLALHGKLRWMTNTDNFWGHDGYIRKYKLKYGGQLELAPDNWYYRFFKIKYKERFPLSATFLVNFTDGYHMCQSISLICLSASFSIAMSLNFFVVWGGVLLVHFVTYMTLQR